MLTKACVTLRVIFPVIPLTSSLHCPACGGSWASWYLPSQLLPRRAFSCSELNHGLHWGLISIIFNRIFNLKFGLSLVFLAQVQIVSFNTGSVICGWELVRERDLMPCATSRSSWPPTHHPSSSRGYGARPALCQPPPSDPGHKWWTSISVLSIPYV